MVELIIIIVVGLVIAGCMTSFMNSGPGSTRGRLLSDIKALKEKESKQKAEPDDSLSQPEVIRKKEPARPDDDYYYQKLKEASDTRLKIDLLAIEKYYRLRRMERNYHNRG